MKTTLSPRKPKTTTSRATINNMESDSIAVQNTAISNSTALGGKSTGARLRRAKAPLAIASPPREQIELHRESKQAKLIATLSASPGATIKQMMALTGWQAHSVRGVISGVLRKKLGLKVICESSPESGERLYRIDSAPVIV